MALFCKRPLTLFCFLLTAATVCGCFFSSYSMGIAAIVCLGLSFLLGIAFVFLKRIGHGLFLILAISLFCLGCGFGNMALRVCPSRDRAALLPENAEYTLEVTVLSQEYVTSYSSEYTVKISEEAPVFSNEKMQLICNYESNWEVGDVLSGTIVLSNLPNEEEARYAYAKAIYVQGESNTPPVRQDHIATAHSFFENLRDSLSASLQAKIKGEPGKLVSALLLGTKNLLSGFTIRDFRRSGMSHLLAISGMHLSLIILMIEWILKKCIVPKSVRCVLILIFSAFYLLLTGLSLSTIRAFFMCAFVYLSYLFQSDNDPITSLFTALAAILLFSPQSSYDVGLWLSFSATLGLLFANELLTALWIHRENNRKSTPLWIRNAVTTVCLSLAASLSTIPILWLFFDELSLITVFSNILLSPLAMILIFLAPFVLLFGYLPLAGTVILGITNFLSKALLSAIRIIADLPGICVSLHYPFLAVFLPICIVVFAVLILFPLKRKWIFPAACGLAIVLFFSLLFLDNAQNKNQLFADYISDDTSEMIVLCDTSQAVIVDISKGSYSPCLQAYQTAQSHQRTEISAYILTHYHSFHVSSLYRLCKLCPIRNLYLPFPQNETEYYTFSALLTMAGEQGISVSVFDRNQPLVFENNVTVSVYDEIYLKRSTHPITSLSIEAFEQKISYAMSSFGEISVLHKQTENLSGADYLILGKHGPVTKEEYILPTYLLPSNTLFIADTVLLSHLVLETMPSQIPIIESTEIKLRLEP